MLGTWSRITMRKFPLINGKSSVCEIFKTWILNKEGGWERFQECTEDNEALKMKLGEFTMVSQPIRLILVDLFVFHFF